VRSGVTGLFFRSETLPEMLKGIATLMNGGARIPHEVLIVSATASGKQALLSVGGSGLTMRETEILTVVSTEATNDQIAEELCISPHTVKTHLYNIFRKIGVGSRFHAALWVTQNLGIRPQLLERRNRLPMAAGE
jgi:LuxR family transcriptional regulator, positive regulator of biofilm formation